MDVGSLAETAGGQVIPEAWAFVAGVGPLNEGVLYNTEDDGDDDGLISTG